MTLDLQKIIIIVVAFCLLKYFYRFLNSAINIANFCMLAFLCFSSLKGVKEARQRTNSLLEKVKRLPFIGTYFNDNASKKLSQEQ